MFAIYDDKICLSWNSREVITTCENKSHIYSSYIPEENFENSILTSYDDIFFNMELSRSINNLFMLFTKYAVTIEESIYINSSDSDGEKISGFDIKQNLDYNSNPLYNYTIIEVLDYLSTQYIVESIIGSWARSKRLNEIDAKSIESSTLLFEEISNQIVHLKRPNYSKSDTIS